MISIIVPVYNTGKFLRDCIDSILSQSYQDFELLLIDDGSTDDSGKICDECAQTDSRVVVFHKPNGGVDSALNMGIDQAKGDYMYFVDSDDKLLPWCLETLLSGMQNDSVDMSVCGYIYSRNGVNDELPTNLPTTRLFSREEMMQELLNPQYQSLGMPWTNLYKSSVIHDNHLLFNKDVHTIDDRLFMVSYICAMKGNAYHTTKPIYIYNLGVGVSFQIKGKYDKRAATIFKGQCLIFDLVKSGGFTNKSIWWAKFRMMNSYYWKSRLFKEYQDYDTIKEMKENLYQRTSKLVYFFYMCRKKMGMFVKRN